ncbi:amidohydrolase [Mesorhizobium sp. LSJC255A00]|uniref:amidohydrolase family protein n=1 Tax=unclassified Mesorhizobium TaxID=325217 RepID=UPI0003CEA157|nr:amidohydrolase [Mesorhizobium sp. LSJC255A00]ESX78095.1 amidohydrolase [Mesorhizobium sp. LSHC414A00]
MTIKEIEKSMFAISEEWLAKHREEILEPDLPIIDAHHHLWDRGHRYMLADMLADIDVGHNIVGTVYVQCRSMYREGGDPDLAPVGEVEFANGVAACAASGTYGHVRVCAGIVGFADLFLGERVDRVLEMHMQRGGERFKGVRHNSPWDADRTIKSTPLDYPPRLLMDPAFRAGFSRLERYGLSFDGWLYHPQIAEFADLARTFPGTTMILDHLGAPLGIGVYAGKREQVFAGWKASMQELAQCKNVYVKLGGLGLHIVGLDLDFRHLDKPSTSAELAQAWRPYIETAIELFGPDRCMFESNFPVDKRSYSYHVLWNAFKRLASSYSASEKANLFGGTAKRAYRLKKIT